MIKKYYWAMAVMAAFVAGTIATATPVFAPPPEDDGEGGWKAAVAEQQAQIDELKANEILGFYPLQDDITYDGTAGIKSSTTDCDSGDVAVSAGYGHGLDPGLVVTASLVFTNNPERVGVDVDSPPPGSRMTLVGICADFFPPHNNAD